MDIKEIRKKTDKELTKLLAEQRDKLRGLNFKVASRQHKNYKELGKMKKEIAKILTVMNEKRLIKELKLKNKITAKTAVAVSSKNISTK